MKTFYTRTLSALVFGVVVLGALLWNDASFFLLCLLIALGSMREYFRLLLAIDPAYGLTSSWHRPCVLLLTGLTVMLGVGDQAQLIHLTASFIALWGGVLVVILLFIEEILFTENFRGRNMWYSLLGLLYIGLPFAMLVNLRMTHSPGGVPVLPLGIILCLWINDTMAYITGSLLGRHPFFPSISPKKTWEGTLGGILLTMAAGALYGYFGAYYRLQDWLVIAALSAVAGTAGDLLESKLKRLAGVTDSGQLMPGHGGFLDRFDSMLAAAPLVWLYALLFLPGA